MAAARQLDLDCVPFPITDLGVVDDDRYDTVTATIERGLRRGAVYVHCWGGIGRTGTVIGCVLTDEGLSYDEIVERLATLRQGSRKENRQAPEMTVQHELIIKRRVALRRDQKRHDAAARRGCAELESLTRMSVLGLTAASSWSGMCVPLSFEPPAGPDMAAVSSGPRRR